MTRAIHDALGWARDTVQSRIVAQVFSQRVHDVAVKGGMALRLGHHKWARATKDIDLDASPELSLPALQQVMRRAIRLATSDGLLKEVRITEPKQTDTTARWKVSGIYPRTGQALNLTVEVSRREPVSAQDVRQVPATDGSGEWVTIYTDQAMAFKKVKALLSDRREAPRDVSDLFLLIKAQVPPPIEHIRRWLAQGGVAQVEQMWAKIERMDQEMFRKEVLPSLPPTSEGQQVYKDWESICLTVGENVQQWIRQAQALDAPASQPRAARARA